MKVVRYKARINIFASSSNTLEKKILSKLIKQIQKIFNPKFSNINTMHTEDQWVFRFRFKDFGTTEIKSRLYPSKIVSLHKEQFDQIKEFNTDEIEIKWDIEVIEVIEIARHFANGKYIKTKVPKQVVNHRVKPIKKKKKKDESSEIQ